MCQFASFKHNPKLLEIVVADWFSHGRTEELTGKTEAQGWYDGHYLPDLPNGLIQCRVPGGVDRVMQAWVRKQWPTLTDFIAWAIKSGADVNAEDDYGRTALYWAAYYGLGDCIKLLLAAKADVNTKDNYGQTALHWAANRGHANCIKLLLAAKATVNIAALHWAVLYNHADCVKLLLAAKADVNVKDNDGRTALYWAVRNGRADCAELLKNAEAKE